MFRDYLCGIVQKVYNSIEQFKDLYLGSFIPCYVGVNSSKVDDFFINDSRLENALLMADSREKAQKKNKQIKSFKKGKCKVIIDSKGKKSIHKKRNGSRR